MRVACVVLTVLAVLGLACPSYATFITCTEGGPTYTEFYDNFEGAAAGSTPNNGVNPGDWAVDEAGGSVRVLTGGDAAEGSKFLKIERDNSYDAYAIASMQDRLTGSGWHIHAEWMMYVPMSSSFQANIQLQDSDGAARAGLLVGANAGLVQFLSSGGGGPWVDATPTYVHDKWQKWTMDYQVGGSTFTFSITTPGGDTQSQTVASYAGGEVGRMFFGGNSNGGSTYYIDAVPAPTPEPSTLTLLITGLFGAVYLLCRKYRRA